LAQFIKLILKDIPGFFDFSNIRFRGILFIKGVYLSYAYYFFFVVSFLGIIWMNRKSILKLLLGLIPLPKFRVSPSDVSKDDFLIVYSAVFCLIYALLDFPVFLTPMRDNIISPSRYVFPLLPFIFIIIAIFLDKISEKVNNKYRFSVFYSLAAFIILIGFVGNLTLIDISGFKISSIPKGYNYVRFGKQIKSCCTFKNNIDQCLDCIKKIGRKDRRFAYEGYEWATHIGLPEVQVYAEKVLRRLDKEYWPFAYERLGETLEKLYSPEALIDWKLADNLQADYLPYVYRGMGRGLMRKTGAVDIKKYLLLKSRIGGMHRSYFHEGIGIEFDEALINNTKKAIQFLNSVDKVDREHIFKGFGRGREYVEIRYAELFMFGFGKLGYNLNKWNVIIGKIEEEFRPDSYQRLGIETGWRFIHGMKKYHNFLDKIDEQYRPFLYKGVGIGIGWRFGYTIDGCKRIIQDFDKRFWPYLYKGLGIGVTRWNGYQLDVGGQYISKVPVDYRPYFEQGINEAFGERYETKG